MKTIRFEIQSKLNPQIHQNGYVEIPNDEDEVPEWFYYDQQGFAVPRVFTHHDGIGLTATDNQEMEIINFNEDIQYNYVDWVHDVILTADEDENETYTKGTLIIQINDGKSCWSDLND